MNLSSAFKDMYSSYISTMIGPSLEKAAGAKDGSQRDQMLADSLRPTRIVCAGEGLPDRLRPTVSDSRNLHGMQKVRGSNPLSFTDFSDLCSIGKCQAKCLSALGFFAALVVAEDVVHHGRSPAYLGHDHMAIDGPQRPRSEED